MEVIPTVVKISNKNIHRYKYMRRSKYIILKKTEKSKMSSGEVYAKVKELKARGVISVSNIDINI